MYNGLKIYSLVQTYGLSDFLAKCAASQAAHETAILGIGFMSPIFKSNNNAYGMKYYAGMPFAIGTKNGYANYLTLEDSVAGFVAWWVKHRANVLSLPLFVNTLEKYVQFLKNNDYFEADESEYLRGCQYFYNQYFG